MILLSSVLDNRVRAGLESAYPEEGCGLLLGKSTPGVARAIEVWETRNEWAGEREKRYAIAPEEMLRAQRAARERELDIIGVYHSHPDRPAMPSETDRQLAWSGYYYLIFSVVGGKTVGVRAWRLDEGGQFREEAIEPI